MINICYTWGNAGIQWSQANWAWDDCQLVADCVKWGDAGVFWMNANWLWSMCSGSVIPPTPPTPSISVGQPLGVDANTLIQPWLIEPWDPYRAADREQEKKKRFIKLICKVKGVTFEEEKEIENYEVSVDDVRMVIKTMSGVDLNIKNVEE